MKIQVVKEIPGQYITVGETYMINGDLSKNGDIQFLHESTGTGTFVFARKVRAGLKNGSLKVIA